jgi:Transposase DDE domain
MNIESIFDAIIVKMETTPKPFRKFLFFLVRAFLSVKGRCNFQNLSRWCLLNEKTFRRNFLKPFNFSLFNQNLIDTFHPNEPFIAAIDCSYVPKSGKKTYGIGKFWSGVHQKSLKGLEISVLSLVSLTNKLCFSLSTVQTPADLNEESRITYYLRQIDALRNYLLNKTKYIVADGFYAKDKFLSQLDEWGFFTITKLRKDADMQYIYTGVQKSKGRKRTNGGKIKWNDVKNIETEFVFEGLTSDGDKIYSQVVKSLKWKRTIKVVYIQEAGTTRYCLLASTDIHLQGVKIVEYYKLRFQIEFLFRDAKQHLGLTDCQSTKQECLDFHFKAVMTTLNLAKQYNHMQGKQTFSMHDLKTAHFNQNWLEAIVKDLDLDLNAIKSHPNYLKVINKGIKNT